MKKICAPLTHVSVLLLLATQAKAAPPVLDQQAPADPSGAFTYALGGPSAQVLYQSLTVGLSGRFAELHLPIGCESGEVILEVFNADTSGLPVAGESPRLTRRFRADLFPTIVSADFQVLPLGGRVGITAGDRIVLVLSNPTGSCGIQAGVPGDPYLGGTGHAEDTINTSPVPLSLSGTDDLPFQTFVRLTGPGTP